MTAIDWIDKDDLHRRIHGARGDGVVVAVLDTGIDITHPAIPCGNSPDICRSCGDRAFHKGSQPANRFDEQQ